MKICIYGQRGSGKTTLAKQICSLFSSYILCDEETLNLENTSDKQYIVICCQYLKSEEYQNYDLVLNIESRNNKSINFMSSNFIIQCSEENISSKIFTTIYFNPNNTKTSS
jgi:uridine kinase